ncbi:MAG TPA: adenylate kinase [Dehalococcoidia bacterium]
MHIVLLGAPGAGKGTQAETLVRETGLLHVSTGDMIREAMQQGTEAGKQAKAYYDRGDLVPDGIIIRMLLDRIAQPDAAKGFILDGFPRNVEQARALDAALTERGGGIDRVLYIKVSREELLDRLSGRWLCRRCGAVYHEKFQPPRTPGVCDRCGGELYQRSDDTRETAENRLRVYFEQTAPLIDYYRERGKLVEVNGEQPVEAVGRDLLAALRAGGPA